MFKRVKIKEKLLYHIKDLGKDRSITISKKKFQFGFEEGLPSKISLYKPEKLCQ